MGQGQEKTNGNVHVFKELECIRQTSVSGKNQHPIHPQTQFNEQPKVLCISCHCCYHIWGNNIIQMHCCNTMGMSLGRCYFNWFG